ncbi:MULTISPECIES: HEAT repeat domain-containing protein [unclassified Microcoleus]|uniref:HEAT repeat domain-containing protein n=1 Tax=unclassified Microcoleus TaxID=2642155 RepID=UPI0025F8F01F|nr:MULTISPECIES: HEAT repeat domain-containing protein [unclassified Microcoleus]
MTKHYRQRLVAVIALSFLSFTSPLLLTRNAAAEKISASKVSPKEIASLIEKLKTNDERELDGAIEKLAKIGKPAIPALIEALRDKNLLVRRSAAQILVRIGSPAIPALVKALKNSDVRVRAAYTLGNIGAETKTAVPQLIVLLKNSDVDVRISAAYALRNIGAEAKAALPQLVPLLKDSNANVRRSAASALGSIGAKAKTALPQLVPLLKDSNANVRGSVASALGSIGFEAKTAVPQLVPLLKDSDGNVRISAAFALGSIGAEAKNAVPHLVSLIKDSEANVRDSAAFALDRIGAEAKAAVPQLVPLLKDSDANVRISAADVLGRIGAEAQTAVPQLVPLLKDSDANVRSSAASALGSIGAEAKNAVPQLVPLLKDSDANVRISAASALGSIGFEAKTAVPQLIPLLKNSDANVRISAADALVSIALSLQEKAKTLTSPDLNQAVSNLESALKILAEPKADFSQSTIANLRVYINVLKAEQNDRLFVKSIIQNPYIWGTGIYLFLLFGTFAIRPLWLLKIYETLKPIGFKIPVLGTDVSLGNLIFFKYHPRVLDAWVTAHIQATRNEFQKRETVRDRKIFVPIPVILDNNTIATLKGKDLQPTFAQKRGCLLIWEEGGAGKTSLACQIGKWAMSDNPEERICSHRMLPVLIEEELNIKVTEGKQPFIEAIRGQLQDLTDTAEPISEELLQQLLKQRRILVIVDHFSEMSEQTRTAIKPGMPDFSVNALLVTSRLQEDLDKVTKTTIKPLRIAGNRLSSFMESYLSQRQKRDLFSSDTEFFDACIQLSTIAGDRNITVLLAKLYADQLIAKKEGTTDGNLPDNIAELMLHYLNQVNHSVTEDKISDSTVQKDAKIIAWECLKSTYRPAAANPKNAIIALGAENPESRIKYLEEKLRIIQTKGVAHDQIHFALDPVAEYLAALHLLDINGTDESKWQDFLNIADSQNSPEGIKGFMLAVKDCYLDEISGAKDTDFLPQQITSRYNVTITAVPVSP